MGETVDITQIAWVQYGALGLLLIGMALVIRTLWAEIKEARRKREEQSALILSVVVENTKAINDLTNKLVAAGDRGGLHVA